MWVGNMLVEQEAIQQIKNVANLPILAGHLAIMPDVHWGKGATVGSVIPTRNAIIPAAVGKDIGCGVCAVLTNLTASDLPENLAPLRHQIERDIPVGFENHKRDIYLPNGFNDIFQKRLTNTIQSFEQLDIRNNLKNADTNKIIRQVGTLGGGNHFVEICLDSENRVWVMLHSGSRGIGSNIGEYAVEMAKN